MKYIRDPVFGYIGVTEVEKNLIDTRPVQRLRRIKQLSVSNIVYPGGDHSRFSHALGTMHLAGEMAESLREDVDLSDYELQMVRLAGLLHDVGHGPFSHSSEEVFSSHLDMTHEDLGRRVIEESQLSDAISEQGYDPDELSELIFGEREEKRYLTQIITSQVDADKMDYLLRDSYFTGVEYGQIDVSRLIQAMEVVGEDIAIDKKALSALEAFMIARYEMFLAVYYHHSARAAEIMLQKAMENVHDILGLTTFDDMEDFLELDDIRLVDGIRKLNPSDYEGEKRKRAEVAKENLRKLDGRELIKPAYDREVHIDDEYVAKVLGDKSVIREREAEIAEKAGLDSDLITVDVPSLASVPYYPREIDPVEIQVFRTSTSGEREIVPLSKHSRLVNVLKGYVDLIRVYTRDQYRDEVEEAAEDVFRELPLSAQVSM
ncbi:MAG: HD domain-containing protein [Candidatus Aenigmatarchaeota archaeon]